MTPEEKQLLFKDLSARVSGTSTGNINRLDGYDRKPIPNHFDYRRLIPVESVISGGEEKELLIKDICTRLPYGLK